MSNRKCDVGNLVRFKECGGVVEKYYNKIGVVTIVEYKDDRDRITCYKIRCIEDGATGWHNRDNFTLVNQKDIQRLGLQYITANFKPVIKISKEFKTVYDDNYKEFCHTLKGFPDEDQRKFTETEIAYLVMGYTLKSHPNDKLLNRFIHGDIEIDFE